MGSWWHWHSLGCKFTDPDLQVLAQVDLLLDAAWPQQRQEAACGEALVLGSCGGGGGSQVRGSAASWRLLLVWSTEGWYLFVVCSN